jgi:hypothetical protein
MRQGAYEIQVEDEAGRVLPERGVDGQTVLQAEQGLTYRVRFRVYTDEDGKFPTDKIWARLYVDGHPAEWQGTKLSAVSRLAPYWGSVAVTFTGFRKNQHEQVAYVFCLPETNKAQCALKETSCAEEGGTLKVIVYRAVDTGRVEDNSANWQSTVPPTVTQVSEDTKLWKRPSVVTCPGKCLASRREGAHPVWETHEQLAILTLPYHSAKTISFLQEFHNAQRERESLAKALNESLPFPGPERPIDLTDGGTTLEVKTEYLRAQPVLVGATTPLLVDLTGEEDIDRNDGPFSKRPRTDVRRALQR